MNTSFDESYWKDPDGTVNESGHRLAQDFERAMKVVQYAKPKESITMCSVCNRKNFAVVGKTEKKELDIWLCPVCDGDALEISRSQPN